MKISFRHIIILLVLLLTHNSLSAQSVEKEKANSLWLTVELNIKKDAVKEVGSTFTTFAKYCRSNRLDTLLYQKILVVGDYFKSKHKYVQLVKWYQFATDSLSNKRNIECLEVNRRLSDIYLLVEDYNKAIELHETNIKHLKIYGTVEGLSQEYSSLAKVYFMRKKYVFAEKYYLKSYNSVQKRGDIFYKVWSCNNLGFFYSTQEKMKSAEKYYLKGLKILKEYDTISYKQRNQKALLEGNLGSIYLKNASKMKLGIVLLKKDMSFNLSKGEVKSGINATVELAQFLIHHKRYSGASKILKKCINNKRIKDLGFSNLLIPVYQELFKIRFELQHDNQILHYFNTYDSLKQERDALKEQRRVKIEKSLLQNILNTQLAYQKKLVDLRDKENQALVEKNKFYQYRMIIGVSALIALLIFLIFYGRKQMFLLRMKKEFAEKQTETEKLEKERAEVELKYKNKDLTDFAIDIAKKQEILSILKSKLIEIRDQKWNEDSYKEKVRELINYANNNLIIENQRQKFQENIKEVNYKFFDTLQLKYPELTELDKQICGLIRLGLSNKEIAIMRNVSYKAIRISRYRIRKKLLLDPEIDMVDFLKSIG